MDTNKLLMAVAVMAFTAGSGGAFAQQHSATGEQLSPETMRPRGSPRYHPNFRYHVRRSRQASRNLRQGSVSPQFYGDWDDPYFNVRRQHRDGQRSNS